MAPGVEVNLQERISVLGEIVTGRVYNDRTITVSSIKFLCTLKFNTKDRNLISIYTLSYRTHHQQSFLINRGCKEERRKLFLVPIKVKKKVRIWKRKILAEVFST